MAIAAADVFGLDEGTETHTATALASIAVVQNVKVATQHGPA